jgi:large exoprotein involved in heme utilization and adhesion
MTTHFSPMRTRVSRTHEPADWPLTTQVTATALALLMAVPFPALAQQLPTGGSVAAGSATIGAPQKGTLNINQSSNQAIINWNTFSVGAGGTVNFNQPSSSAATLNRAAQRHHRLPEPSTRPALSCW